MTRITKTLTPRQMRERGMKVTEDDILKSTEPSWVKKDKEKRGKPKSDEVTSRQARQYLLKSHPEIMETMVAAALGKEEQITCPYCKEKFGIKTCKGADRELLMHLDNRVQGKPTTVTQLDAVFKVDLSNGQLMEIWNRAKQAAITVNNDIKLINIFETEVTKVPEEVQKLLEKPKPDYQHTKVSVPDLMASVIPQIVTDTEEIDKITRKIDDDYVSVTQE